MAEGDNEAALLLAIRKLREGFALALHGLEVDVDDAQQVVHLRPRADQWVSVEDVMLSELAHSKQHLEARRKIEVLSKEPAEAGSKHYR